MKSSQNYNKKYQRVAEDAGESGKRRISVQAAMCKNVVQPLADAEHAIEDTVGMVEMLKYLNELLADFLR